MATLKDLEEERDRLLKENEYLKNENAVLNRANAELDELLEHYLPDKQMKG